MIDRCPHCGRLAVSFGEGAGVIPLGYGGRPPPLASAPFNLREIVKELLLLERHTFDAAQRCADCITKHLLTIEALAQEAAGLDGAEQWAPLIHATAGAIKELERRFLAGEDLATVGQAARALRKMLAPRVFRAV